VKICKLKARQDFLSLQKYGVYIRSGAVCVQFGVVNAGCYASGAVNCVFFGFTASRKVGGAVDRNRAKRRLRVLAVNNVVEYFKKSKVIVSPKFCEVRLSNKTLQKCDDTNICVSGLTNHFARNSCSGCVVIVLIATKRTVNAPWGSLSSDVISAVKTAVAKHQAHNDSSQGLTQSNEQKRNPILHNEV
jgi:ribonuclease P protein component